MSGTSASPLLTSELATPSNIATSLCSIPPLEQQHPNTLSAPLADLSSLPHTCGINSETTSGCEIPSEPLNSSHSNQNALPQLPPLVQPSQHEQNQQLDQPASLHHSSESVLSLLQGLPPDSLTHVGPTLGSSLCSQDPSLSAASELIPGGVESELPSGKTTAYINVSVGSESPTDNAAVATVPVIAVAAVPAATLATTARVAPPPCKPLAPVPAVQASTKAAVVRGIPAAAAPPAITLAHATTAATMLTHAAAAAITLTHAAAAVMSLPATATLPAGAVVQTQETGPSADPQAALPDGHSSFATQRKLSRPGRKNKPPPAKQPDYYGFEDTAASLAATNAMAAATAAAESAAAAATDADTACAARAVKEEASAGLDVGTRPVGPDAGFVSQSKQDPPFCTAAARTTGPRKAGRARAPKHTPDASSADPDAEADADVDAAARVAAPPVASLVSGRAPRKLIPRLMPDFEDGEDILDAAALETALPRLPPSHVSAVTTAPCKLIPRLLPGVGDGEDIHDAAASRTAHPRLPTPHAIAGSTDAPAARLDTAGAAAATVAADPVNILTTADRGVTADVLATAGVGDAPESELVEEGALMVTARPKRKKIPKLMPDFESSADIVDPAFPNDDPRPASANASLPFAPTGPPAASAALAVNTSDGTDAPGVTVSTGEDGAIQAGRRKRRLRQASDDEDYDGGEEDDPMETGDAGPGGSVAARRGQQLSESPPCMGRGSGGRGSRGGGGPRGPRRSSGASQGTGDGTSGGRGDGARLAWITRRRNILIKAEAMAAAAAGAAAPDPDAAMLDLNAAASNEIQSMTASHAAATPGTPMSLDPEAAAAAAPAVGDVGELELVPPQTNGSLSLHSSQPQPAGTVTAPAVAVVPLQKAASARPVISPLGAALYAKLMGGKNARAAAFAAAQALEAAAAAETARDAALTDAAVGNGGGEDQEMADISRPDQPSAAAEGSVTGALVLEVATCSGPATATASHTAPRQNVDLDMTCARESTGTPAECMEVGSTSAAAAVKHEQQASQIFMTDTAVAAESASKADAGAGIILADGASADCAPPSTALVLVPSAILNPTTLCTAAAAAAVGDKGGELAAAAAGEPRVKRRYRKKTDALGLPALLTQGPPLVSPSLNGQNPVSLPSPALPPPVGRAFGLLQVGSAHAAGAAAYAAANAEWQPIWPLSSSRTFRGMEADLVLEPNPPDLVPGNRIASVLAWIKSVAATQGTKEFDVMRSISYDRKYRMESYRMRNATVECTLPELDPLAAPGNSRKHGYLKQQQQQQRAQAVVEEEGQCRRSGRVRQAPTPIYVPGVVVQSRYYRTELCLGELFQAVIPKSYCTAPPELDEETLAMMGTLMRPPDEMDPELAQRIAANDAAGAASAKQDMANARLGLLPESMRNLKHQGVGSDSTAVGLLAASLGDDDEPPYSPTVTVAEKVRGRGRKAAAAAAAEREEYSPVPTKQARGQARRRAAEAAAAAAEAAAVAEAIAEVEAAEAAEAIAAPAMKEGGGDGPVSAAEAAAAAAAAGRGPENTRSEPKTVTSTLAEGDATGMEVDETQSNPEGATADVTPAAAQAACASGTSPVAADSAAAADAPATTASKEPSTSLTPNPSSTPVSFIAPCRASRQPSSRSTPTPSTSSASPADKTQPSSDPNISHTCSLPVPETIPDHNPGHPCDPRVSPQDQQDKSNSTSLDSQDAVVVEVVGYPTQGRPIVTLGQIGSVLEETLSPGQGLSRAVCAKFAKEPSSSVAELADLASASAEKPAAAALSPVVAPSKQERVLVAAGKRAAKAAAAAAAAEKPLADVAKAVGVASVEGEESAGAMVVVKATTAAAADGAVVDAASPDVSESVQEEMRIAARDAFLVAVREREAHLEAQYLAMAPEAVMAMGVNDAGHRLRWQWSDEDLELFGQGMTTCGKDFKAMQVKFLPHKSHGQLISAFCNIWKTRSTAPAIDWHDNRRREKALRLLPPPCSAPGTAVAALAGGSSSASAKDSAVGGGGIMGRSASGIASAGAKEPKNGYGNGSGPVASAAGGAVPTKSSLKKESVKNGEVPLGAEKGGAGERKALVSSGLGTAVAPKLPRVRSKELEAGGAGRKRGRPPGGGSKAKKVKGDESEEAEPLDEDADGLRDGDAAAAAAALAQAVAVADSTPEEDASQPSEGDAPGSSAQAAATAAAAEAGDVKAPAKGGWGGKRERGVSGRGRGGAKAAVKSDVEVASRKRNSGPSAASLRRLSIVQQELEKRNIGVDSMVDDDADGMQDTAPHTQTSPPPSPHATTSMHTTAGAAAAGSSKPVNVRLPTDAPVDTDSEGERLSGGRGCNGGGSTRPVQTKERQQASSPSHSDSSSWEEEGDATDDSDRRVKRKRRKAKAASIRAPAVTANTAANTAGATTSTSLTTSTVPVQAKRPQGRPPSAATLLRRAAAAAASTAVAVPATTATAPNQQQQQLSHDAHTPSVTTDNTQHTSVSALPKQAQQPEARQPAAAHAVSGVAGSQATLAAVDCSLQEAVVVPVQPSHKTHRSAAGFYVAPHPTLAAVAAMLGDRPATVVSRGVAVGGGVSRGVVVSGGVSGSGVGEGAQVMLAGAAAAHPVNHSGKEGVGSGAVAAASVTASPHASVAGAGVGGGAVASQNARDDAEMDETC